MVTSILHKQSTVADNCEWMLQFGLSILVLSLHSAKVLYSAFLHLWVSPHNAPLAQPTSQYVTVQSPVIRLP